MKHNLNLSSLMHELTYRASDKLCPMKMAAGKEETCAGNHCAWWDKHQGDCRVGNTEAAIGYIAKIVFSCMSGGRK